MIADMTAATIHLKDLQQILGEQGKALGLDIKVQHEDIFRIMHQI
jgi:ACT domain-containing protein